MERSPAQSLVVSNVSRIEMQQHNHNSEKQLVLKREDTAPGVRKPRFHLAQVTSTQNTKIPKKRRQQLDNFGIHLYSKQQGSFR